MCWKKKLGAGEVVLAILSALNLVGSRPSVLPNGYPRNEATKWANQLVIRYV